MVIQTKEGCISKTPECTKVSKSALNSTVHLEVDKSAIVSIKRKKKKSQVLCQRMLIIHVLKKIS